MVKTIFSVVGLACVALSTRTESMEALLAFLLLGCVALTLTHEEVGRMFTLKELDLSPCLPCARR